LAGTRDRLLAVLLIVIVILGGVAYVTYSQSVRMGRLEAQVSSLRAELDSEEAEPVPPVILLRTWGTALGSYVEGPNEMTYLRLTVSGRWSGVESSFASNPFNASVSGNSVTWIATANHVAADLYHNFWPMVLENAPNGTDAIAFEVQQSVQEIAVRSNGSAAVFPVQWSVVGPHQYKIVISSPGSKVDFYIDGVLVKSLVTGPCPACSNGGLVSQAPYIPNVGFLIEGAEVDSSSQFSSGVATLEVYGGLLNSTNLDSITTQAFT